MTKCNTMQICVALILTASPVKAQLVNQRAERQSQVRPYYFL